MNKKTDTVLTVDDAVFGGTPVKKKPKGKAPAGRRAIKPSAPGEAAAIMKTFMNLERIKGKIAPTEADFLSDHDRWESLLDLTRSVRDMGTTDEDEAFFYMTYTMDQLAEERKEADAELIRLSKAIDAKYKEYGAAEDDYWPDGEAPEDMEELRTAYDERSRQIDAAVMREHGEGGMADLYLNDEKEFFRRRVRGALLLAKDDQEKLGIVKGTFRQIIVNRGWSDLLPGFDM